MSHTVHERDEQRQHDPQCAPDLWRGRGRDQGTHESVLRLARERRDRQRRRRRRRRIAGLAVAGVALLALSGVVILQIQQARDNRRPENIPSHTTADGTGILLSPQGAPSIHIYLDYLCPECRRVESVLAPTLERMASDGGVTVVFHPMSLLDEYSDPHGYSTRAGSAAACAADAGEFLAFSNALFAQQPREHTPGLSAEELIGIGQRVGIGTSTFVDCVRANTYKPWVEYVTNHAYSQNIAATPTVMVNGKRLTLDGDDLVQRLTTAVRATAP